MNVSYLMKQQIQFKMYCGVHGFLMMCSSEELWESEKKCTLKVYMHGVEVI